MKLKDSLVHLSLKGKRTIVLSDIHGSTDLFKALLSKVNYSDKDVLIINGDMIDKGRDSIGTLKLIQSLLEENNHKNIYMTKGNCDCIFDELDEPFLYGYMDYRHTIVHECLKVLGKTRDDYASQSELAKEVRENFSDLHGMLKDLPLGIETEDFLFVHAGLNESDYLNSDEETVLTRPFFYNSVHDCPKMVVTGHYPVCNFVEDGLMNHNIKVNEQKRMIAMDGGNQVKISGILNALIIGYDGDNYKLDYISVHDYPMKEVIQPFEVTYQEPHTFTYPYFEIEVFDGDEYFTSARHKHTGTEFMVKTEYIVKDDQGTRLLDDYTDYFMNVATGEKVAVIQDNYSGYTFIMKDGITGWVPDEVFGL